MNANLSTNEVIVQLSPVGRDLKLLHMNNFVEAISTDPDLSSIPVADRAKILQVLYVATGCDFTSFFVGIGKAAFLNKGFFRFSKFISGQCTNQSGTLTNLDPGSNGFLAFLRLVGVAYYLKHQGAFESTPSSYYNSFNTPGTQCQKQHTLWYYGIRAKAWERITFEDHLPPSIEALELHWLRTVWTIDYWSQASDSHILLLPLEWFGWQVHGTTISVEWDSSENVEQVRNRVAFLTHGCSCKTGCTTRRCKCVKAAQQCGPGCSCNHHSVCQNSNNDLSSEGTVLL